ncbi:hypothetical protein M422DRAFT_241837 [Sphaerobolus stellatus SS14]|nr:hypothetical protein M422DRAFT_241837 [Sphaerobolus stellatus SS14]
MPWSSHDVRGKLTSVFELHSHCLRAAWFKNGVVRSVKPTLGQIHDNTTLHITMPWSRLFHVNSKIRSSSSISTQTPSTTSESTSSPPKYSELQPSPPEPTIGKKSVAVDESPLAIPQQESPCNGCVFDEFSEFNEFMVSGSDRAALEERTDELLEHIVRQKPNDCAVNALESCIAACKFHKLELASLLHRTPSSRAGYSPLFCVIMNAPSDDPLTARATYRLLDCLFQAPLTESTRLDIHKACIIKSYQGFFQYARKAPGFQSYSVSPDHTQDFDGTSTEDVKVFPQSGGLGSFRVEWRVPRFQHRLRVSPEIATEFVAQGHVWFICLGRLASANVGFRTYIISRGSSKSKSIEPIEGKIAFSKNSSESTEKLKTVIPKQKVKFFTLKDHCKEIRPADTNADGIVDNVIHHINGGTKCPLRFDTQTPSTTSESTSSPPKYSELQPSPPEPTIGKKSVAVDESPLAIPQQESPCNGCVFDEFSEFNEFMVSGSDRAALKKRTNELLEHIVRQKPNDCAANALESCIAACKFHKLELASLLHHPPSSWAGYSLLFCVIMNAPSDDPLTARATYRLLDCLFQAPLTESTRLDVHRACTIKSYQGFFQYARKAPGFQSHSVSPADTLDFDGTSTEDVKVFPQSGGLGSFRVEWRVLRFQHRLRVHARIATEFVAQGLASFFFSRIQAAYKLHSV